MVPAMYGILPRFVARPVLSSAIAVASSYTQLAIFVGPALAGWIIVSHSITAAFMVNALGYLILLISFLCLRTPAGYRQPEPSPHTVTRDILEGAVYIFRDKRIFFLLTLGLFSHAIGAGFYHMAPAYAEQVLGLGVVGLSTILASRGLGATGAALWLAHGGAPAASLERVLWASMLAMLALAVLVLIENLYAAAAVAAVMGFASETRKTGTMTIIQLSVAESQRGRVMGTLFMLSQLSAGIGAYLIGAWAAYFGVQTPLLVGVAVCVAAWLLLYLCRGRLFQMS